MNRLLNNEDNDNDYIQGEDIIRSDNWYIAIEVYSDLEKDGLSQIHFPEHQF